MTAATAPPPPLRPAPSSAVVVDDAAFEAFASCRFEDAARLAALELAQPHQEDTRATTPPRPTQGVLLPCLLPDGQTEAGSEEGRIFIKLQEHCARSDKLAAILVQCAYELKQEAEESLFVQHYATQGSIPFPVALIWLQVCLAKGGAHYGTVRRVLLQLLTALEEEEEGPLLPPVPAKPETDEFQSLLPQPQEEEGGGRDKVEEEAVVAAAAAPPAPAAAGEGEDEEDRSDERKRSLLGMYGQAMELLVLKVMLALGEGEAALERVRADKHLEGRVRQTLLDACHAAVKRQRAVTPPAARRSTTWKREEQQRGARSQHQRKEDTTTTSSLSTRGAVLSSPPTSSSSSSQALNTTTMTRATPHSLLSGFFSNLWGHPSETQQRTPSSSSSSFSASSSSSSPSTLRQHLLSSSPHQLLLSFLGFVALALGFHSRRDLGMGSRELARKAARLLQRIVTVVLLGGDKTTTTTAGR